MTYSADDVKVREFLLRMLIVSPPKSGKTTCAVMTSPGPRYVINSDGMGALDPIALMGGKFTADDCTNIRTFDKCLKFIQVHKDDFNTIILDNISSLSEAFEDELKKSGNYADGRQLYPELKNRLMYVIRSLLAIPQNLVVIGHVENDGNMKGGFGHILNVAGKAKISIPMMLQDWVWLDVSIDQDTKIAKREFLLAPQGNWTKGVRSLRDVTSMEANVTKFIELVKSRYKSNDKSEVKSVVVTKKV